MGESVQNILKNKIKVRGIAAGRQVAVEFIQGVLEMRAQLLSGVDIITHLQFLKRNFSKLYRWYLHGLA